MFLTVDEAKLQLVEWVDPPLIEQFLTLLVPVTEIHAISGGDAQPGSHQIGGTPKAGSGLDWPRVDPQALLPGALQFGRPDMAAERRAHLDAGVPMTFIGQLELSELADIPALAALPDDGRLLFFYDFVLGSNESNANNGRVIWDRTDPADIIEIAPPEALTRRADTIRREIAQINKDFNSGEDWDGFSTIFAATERPARIETGLELRSPYMLDDSGFSARLKAAMYGDGSDDEMEMFAQYEEAYEASRGEEASALRLLGSAIPEQDDPAYGPAVTVELGMQFPSQEELQANWDRIEAARDDWVLLAQLDVAAWLDDNSEGQVYFMIRKDDLAAQRFDRVIPVYQQT